jgi:hypothetical protein
MANEEWSKATIFGKRVRFTSQGFKASIGPFLVYIYGGWPGALCDLEILMNGVVVESRGPFKGNWREAIAYVEWFIARAHNQLTQALPPETTKPPAD